LKRNAFWFDEGLITGKNNENIPNTTYRTAVGEQRSESSGLCNG